MFKLNKGNGERKKKMFMPSLDKRADIQLIINIIVQGENMDEREKRPNIL